MYILRPPDIPGSRENLQSWVSTGRRQRSNATSVILRRNVKTSLWWSVSVGGASVTFPELWVGSLSCRSVQTRFGSRRYYRTMRNHLVPRARWNRRSRWLPWWSCPSLRCSALPRWPSSQPLTRSASQLGRRINSNFCYRWGRHTFFATQKYRLFGWVCKKATAKLWHWFP